MATPVIQEGQHFGLCPSRLTRGRASAITPRPSKLPLSKAAGHKASSSRSSFESSGTKVLPWSHKRVPPGNER